MTQYGVMFRDGSVMHPWNGRTQEQRAREAHARFAADCPGDNIRLVVRSGPGELWHEPTPPHHDYTTDSTTKGVCTLCGRPPHGHDVSAPAS